MDRNHLGQQNPKPAEQSLSARRAWIEINVSRNRSANNSVALRKESVDRNVGAQEGAAVGYVALRKESVDRNTGG